MTDEKLVFSSGQSVTADAASTNVVDLGALTDDRGTALSEFGPEGGQLRLVVILPTVTTKTGTSIKFTLQSSSDDAVGDAFADTEITKTVLAAPMVAGYEVLNIALPPGLERYIRMYYDVTDGGQAFSVTVDARLRWGQTS